MVLCTLDPSAGRTARSVDMASNGMEAILTRRYPQMALWYRRDSGCLCPCGKPVKRDTIL